MARHRAAAPAEESPLMRSLHARIAANTRWSREDPNDPDGPLPRARAAADARFLEEVDPERVLPEAERNRRAEAARKAHYQRMAYRSAVARRGRSRRRPAAGAGGGS